MLIKLIILGVFPGVFAAPPYGPGGPLLPIFWTARRCSQPVPIHRALLPLCGEHAAVHRVISGICPDTTPENKPRNSPSMGF